MARTKKKMYVNDRVGAAGLNLFDTSRAIGDVQLRTLTNMIPTTGGTKMRFGYRVFNEDLTKTGGIPMLYGYNSVVFTPAFLTGGTSATAVVATWNAVANGSFAITVDGKTKSIININFAAAVTMDNVATIIQTAIIAQLLVNVTVAWSTNKFIISSVDTSINSSITVTSATGVGTDISGVGGTPFMDAETGRGVVTDRVYIGREKQIIFANADKYYHLAPEDAVDTAWNLIGDYGTSVENPHAFTASGYVIFGTGLVGNTPKKWDGTNFTNIQAPPVAGIDLSFFEFFQGQDFAALFGAGDPTHPSRLYYSDADDPDKWVGGSSGFIDIALNDNSDITGLKVQGEQLIVYKNKKKYYISTYYESDAGVYGIRVEPYIDIASGTLCHDSIQVLPNGDILALGHKEVGLQGLGKLQASDGSLIPKDYSRAIYPLFAQLNYNQIKKVRTALFKKMLFISVPFGKSATNNNYVFVYHTDVNGWSVIPDTSIGSWLVFEDENGDEVLYAGDSERPIIYKWDENEFTDNGELISGVLRSGKLNLGSIIDFEDLEVIALEGSKLEAEELKLTVITDNVESTYVIDDDYLVQFSGDGGGFIANDFIAEQYNSGDEDAVDELRWIALLLVSAEQRKAREIEIQLENLTIGSKFSWNYLSINEMDFQNSRLIEENQIINMVANI